MNVCWPAGAVHVTVSSRQFMASVRNKGWGDAVPILSPGVSVMVSNVHVRHGLMVVVVVVAVVVVVVGAGVVVVTGATVVVLGATVTTTAVVVVGATVTIVVVRAVVVAGVAVAN